MPPHFDVLLVTVFWSTLGFTKLPGHAAHFLDHQARGLEMLSLTGHTDHL